jgi:anti-sigma factor RsiW
MADTFECGGDSAAYVLGALDTRECALFEHHLNTCTVCQAEIESFQGLAHVLGMAAPQYPLPPKLRRRVLAQVRAEARAETRERTVTRSLPRPTIRRERTRQLHRPGLVGAVAMAVLLAALIVASLLPHGRRLHTQIISASVGSAQIVMRSGHGEMIVRHLAPLGPSRTYEVWLKRKGGSAPQPTADLFNVSANGSTTVGLPNMQGVIEVMVTQEPAGGRAVPSSAPVVIARI